MQKLYVEKLQLRAFWGHVQHFWYIKMLCDKEEDAVILLHAS